MRVAVTIQGIAPLLMNRFTEQDEVSVSSGTRMTFRGDKGTPREQATPKAYRQPDSGDLFLPGANIFACLIQAGTFHKSGKSKLTTMKTSLIPGGVAVEEMICPLFGPDGEALRTFEVDSRSIVVPSTGGRVMCHRPRLDQWLCRFTLEVDTEMFSPNLIRDVLDDAGKKIGIGDFRPARKGPFGRFVCASWTVVEPGALRVA